MADVDKRRKNVSWQLPTGDMTVSFEAAQLAVLMDIRDELQAIRALANCYRIPRALDALIESGAEARRKKRLAARKRKASK